MSTTPSDSVFAAIFTTDELLAATSGQAWVQAMLDAEAALVLSLSDLGLVELETAEAVASMCSVAHFDVNEIAHEARLGANPAIPLVVKLVDLVRQEKGDLAASVVHRGATSQDIVDTASMLVSKRAIDLVLRHLYELAKTCAQLAEDHRTSVMAGRTLLQQALPVTFGLKAGGWLVSVLESLDLIERVRTERLAVQLGGAVGTLASFGQIGPDVVAHMANRLALIEPLSPWHTGRARLAEIASALTVGAGSAGKIALDVTLLMQTEVGEAFEVGPPGHGGSSSMPHKRNPAFSAEILAAARRANSACGLLHASMLQEHERSAGLWHTEWEALTDVLRSSGGAIAGAQQVVASLEVHPEVMRSNLADTGEILLAERVQARLVDGLGRAGAQKVVGTAVDTVFKSGRSFSDVLLEDPLVQSQINRDELMSLLDPSHYLGATDLFIDRALDAYRSRSSSALDELLGGSPHAA